MTRPAISQRGIVLAGIPVAAGFLVLLTGGKAAPLALLVLLALVGSTLVVLLSRRPAPYQRGLGRALPPGQRWIALAWVGMFLISAQKFTTNRDPLDAASGSISPEILAELFVYGLAAIAMFRHWQPARGTASRPIHARWLFAWPLAAVVSTSWSVVPLFSLVRGSELLIPPLLAVHTARVIREAGDGGQALVRRTFRLFLVILTLLTAWGWTTPWPYTGTRYAWNGSHPLQAAELLGVGIIVLLIAGKSLLGLRAWVRFPMLVFFGITLVYTQPRTDYVALGFAVLTGLWYAGRHRIGYRTLGLMYYGAGLATFLALLRGQIFQIASQGGGYANAVTLDGRTSLWQLSLQELSSVRAWLIGNGYGSPRVTVYKQAQWSGSAHSSPIEILLGLGLIGLVLFLGMLGWLAWGLATRKRTEHLHPRVQVLGITLFAFLVVHGVVSSELVIPGFSCTMLFFLGSFVLARPAPESNAASESSAELAGRHHGNGHGNGHARLRAPARFR